MAASGPSEEKNPAKSPSLFDSGGGGVSGNEALSDIF